MLDKCSGFLYNGCIKLIKGDIMKKTTLRNIQTGLIIVITAILTTLALDSRADNFNYSVGISQSKMEYKWYGASEAAFLFDLTTIKLEAEHESGFSVKYGYGFTWRPDTQTTITNQVFTIDFQKYREIELAYNIDITDKLEVYAGIGYYWQSVPIYDVTGNDLVHYDEDNDRGGFIGLRYKFTDNFDIDVFIKQTSKIGELGSCNQECQDNWVAKGSTIRQIGVGFNILF